MTFLDANEFACELRNRAYQNLVYYPYRKGYRFRFDDFAGRWEAYVNDDSMAVLRNYDIVKFQSLMLIAPHGGYVLKKGAPSQNAKGVAKFSPSRLKGTKEA